MSGRRRALVYAFVVVCALAAGVAAAVALASSGGLDPTFGTSGTTVLERPTDTYPVPDALASGGRIVLVSTGEPGRITVTRLLPDGQPDPSFDGNGEAVIEASGGVAAHAVAVQPNGKIVVVGYREVGASEQDATVWRLDAEGGSSVANGDLDPTFGTGGAVELKAGVDADANAVALQPDGKIVVAGVYYTGSGHNRVAAWRLTPDGGLDASFGESGFRGISDGAEDVADAVAVGPEGKIVLAGTSDLAIHPPDAVAWRLDADGAPDTTFDTDGQADIDSGGEDFADAVAVEPDGQIVLAGDSGETSKPRRAMVWRLKVNGGEGATNGALDPTFGDAGTATLTGLGNAEGGAIALQPDGKILLAGSTRAETGPSLAALWRLLANGGTSAVNGALDPSFGNGGIITVAADEGAFADSIALSSDRRAVVSGATFDSRALLFRALGDPFTLSVVRGGGGSGSVDSLPGGIECGATCAAAFDDGSQVTLSASAAAGSVFAGWSGGECSGAGTCTLSAIAEQTVTATFDALPAQQPATQPAAQLQSTVPEATPLGAPKLRFVALKRDARSFSVTVRGLPAGTKVSASLLAGRTLLARATATVSAGGSALLRFSFSRSARRRLRSRALRTLKLEVAAALGSRHSPGIATSVRLAR